MTRFFALSPLLAISLFAQTKDRPVPRFPPDIAAPKAPEGRDASRVDPKHYALEFENDGMRALRLTLQANETVPAQDTDALFVCLKECHVRMTRADGRTEDLHLEPGKTRWISGNIRSERNLTAQGSEILVIELKRPARSN